jgi:hypothetical protein
MFTFLKTSLDPSAAESRFKAPNSRRTGPWVDRRRKWKNLGGFRQGGAPVNLTTPLGLEWAARFSPDSKWLADSSEESGRSERYVRAFPGHPDPSATKLQLSNNGGEYPMSNDAGTELYYATSADVFFAVDTRGLAAGKLSAPIRLFKACRQSLASNIFGGPYGPPLDTRDGKDFLLSCLVDPPVQYTVLMNWHGTSR